MKKFALIVATCAALAPGFAAAGNVLSGSSDPAPGVDDPFAVAASSVDGTLGTGGAVIAGMGALAFIAAMAGSSSTTSTGSSS